MGDLFPQSIFVKLINLCIEEVVVLIVSEGLGSTTNAIMCAILERLTSFEQP